MKKSFLLVLLLIVVFSLAACGKSTLSETVAVSDSEWTEAFSVTAFHVEIKTTTKSGGIVSSYNQNGRHVKMDVDGDKLYVSTTTYTPDGYGAIVKEFSSYYLQKNEDDTITVFRYNASTKRYYYSEAEAEDYLYMDAILAGLTALQGAKGSFAFKDGSYSASNMDFVNYGTVETMRVRINGTRLYMIEARFSEENGDYREYRLEFSKWAEQTAVTIPERSYAASDSD